MITGPDRGSSPLPQILRAALPIILAAFFCALTLQASSGRPVDIDFTKAGYGSMLLAGLPCGSVNWYMPFHGALLSAALNLGISFPVFLVVSQVAVYALVFCAGCLIRGYWGGILSLAGTGLLAARNYDSEQSIYTILLLLVLLSLLLRRGKSGAGYALLAGLSVGATLLFRTPLFLFPPVLLFCSWFCGPSRGRAFLRHCLVFLAASYVLLVPWSLLNHSLTGSFSPFAGGHAAGNMLTAAKGGIYGLEGDAARLAGIKEGESPVRFYLTQTVKHPLFSALTVLRRLFEVFKFSPFLYGGFILALVLCRRKENAAVLALPVYFILLHSLFAIEKRYFYPLLGLLPPLIAGALLPERFDLFPEWRAFAKKTAAAAFVLSFSAVLLLEGFILAYPARSDRNRRPEAFYKALERFPNDRALQYQKCKGFLLDGDEAGFSGCLDGYSRKFDDKFMRYFLSVKRSGSPAAVELPEETDIPYFPIAVMLREFELGNEKAAMSYFTRAYKMYGDCYNVLGGTPYKRDRELSQAMKNDLDAFWDNFVYRVLLLWPPGGMVRILSGIEKNFSLSPSLKPLAKAAAGPRPQELMDGWWLRKRRALGIWSPDSGHLEQPPAAGARESRQLAGLASRKIGSGDPAAGKALLLEALDLDPDNPEALVSLCSVLSGENKKEQALDACMRAVASAYGEPGLQPLVSDAASRSARLFKELGHKADAKKALRLAAEPAF